MRRPGLTTALIAVGVATVALTVAFGSRFGVDPQLSASPLIGKPVPDAVVTMVPDGEPLALRDLAGEIVVVNFWAPWCLPCRDEHPELIAVADRFREAGVRVLGIAYQSDYGHIIQYLDELGWGYDVATDERSRAAIGFGIRGVPETFFVDRNGDVVAKITGPVNRELMSATIERIIVGAPVDSGTTGTVQPAP